MTHLQLPGEGMEGRVPAGLGRLTGLMELNLSSNNLSGPIPAELGRLTGLVNLELSGNRLSGYEPAGLRSQVLFSDLSMLNLETCPANQSPTAETPHPTYMVTVAAGAGGAIAPDDDAEYTEASEVTLTASWNDATHTLAGWSGDCEGSETTCTLVMYDDYTVEATFDPLPADRCAAPTDADCIRAVYLGAPSDYPQVQDIPAELLLSPDSSGHYQVERGQQITVVTAAPLPSGFDRFYLRLTPDSQPSATSFFQLIPPVGTTYTLTVSDDERAANLFTYHLHAARNRPGGGKPSLGHEVVTIGFLVPTLRYDRLDATGTASTQGSYAFLQTAGDTSSTFTNFGYLPSNARELRISTADASGAHKTSFYESVAVGDTFDYQTNPTDCGFRFSVTRMDRSSASLTLGLDFISQYGGWCRGFVDDPSASHSVWFVWRPGPGLPTPEGIPVLLTHETVGPGTYRIWEFGPWIFDVPPGSSITLRGFFEHTDEGHDPDPVLLTALMIFHDGNVTSSLHIDPHTGLEDRRTARTAKAHEVFDHIINSMRLAE